MAPTLVSIRVEPQTGNFASVTPVWSGVDRPESSGWSVPKKLVDRFVTAIKAGVIFDRVAVQTDVNGKTYVATGCRVLLRHLNADLKKIGF